MSIGGIEAINRLAARTERGADVDPLWECVHYRLGLLSPLPASPRIVEQDGTEEFSP